MNDDSDSDNDNDISEKFNIHETTNKQMLVPRIINGFTLFNKNQETKMSVVFDLNDSNHVMKCIPIRFFKQSEVDLMASINHQNIIKHKTYFKFPSDNPRFASIVMPRAQCDLLQYLCDNIIPENMVCKIICDSLNGLKYLHGNGIWHRDIKLENIFVMRETERGPLIVIGDLGEAKRYGSGFVNKPPAGTIVYAAPELLKLDPNSPTGCCFLTFARYNSNIDIYSLGVVMYALLFKRLPFGEEKGHDAYAHLQGNVNFPNDTGLVSNEAINLIQQMLCTNPMSRPTVDEVLNHEWFNKFGMSSKSMEQSKCFQMAQQYFRDIKDVHD